MHMPVKKFGKNNIPLEPRPVSTYEQRLLFVVLLLSAVAGELQFSDKRLLKGKV